MRIVLDTNIYVGVALQGELTVDIFEEIAKNPTFTLITSKDLLVELDEKLKKKFFWPTERREIFLYTIREISEIVVPNEKLDIIKRDPNDNKVLECAFKGKANLIITADQDLIKLKTFRGIAIIHPKTFTWTFPEYFKKRHA